jgi:hypothetical protein
MFGHGAVAHAGTMRSLGKMGTEQRHAAEMRLDLERGRLTERVSKLATFAAKNRVKEDLPLIENANGSALLWRHTDGKMGRLIVKSSDGQLLHPSASTIVEHGLLRRGPLLRQALANASRPMDTVHRLEGASSITGFKTLAAFAEHSPRELVRLFLKGQPLPLVLQHGELVVVKEWGTDGGFVAQVPTMRNAPSVAHLSRSDLAEAFHETAKMIVDKDPRALGRGNAE